MRECHGQVYQKSSMQDLGEKIGLFFFFAWKMNAEVK